MDLECFLYSEGAVFLPLSDVGRQVRKFNWLDTLYEVNSAVVAALDWSRMLSKFLRINDVIYNIYIAAKCCHASIYSATLKSGFIGIMFGLLLTCI